MSNLVFPTLVVGNGVYSMVMGKRRLVSRRDRELLLREKLLDLGNIVVSGLLISQIFKSDFNYLVALVGVLATTTIYLITYYL